ncbi:TetR/AcrR family transcriptional regulator [Polyangium jinanense]|uniref:TetR/AcrR family transcriptional regulator n=1 Tax=Polyangium jinanense TaxID=2829994 RepID=A0A9X4AR26_9BACT|nr:TetR/AcrR family transcriptional regulator [Polyangium jinanense]MDC3954703.1 TetR/AcrR family transcriptional regulator [Polyangium jinanense]MDC3981006.1 TetR/AcrR family transcriptional regulator [Polyangium jinanense]
MTSKAFDPQPRKWPRQGRSRATFDALLDATARILEDHGYEELTTNAVAQRAGASIGTLYEYFPDRETLVAVLVEREARRVLAALEASMASLHDMPLEAAMRIWLEAMFAELESRRALVAVLLKSVPFVGRLPIASEFPARLVAIAARGGSHRREEIALDDLPSAFFLLTNMLRGAYLAMLLEPPEGFSRRALLDDLTVFVMRMLRARE